VQPREHALLKAIEKVVKQRIEPARIPSVADVKARRIVTLVGALRDTLVEGAFDNYRVAVQSLAEEYDALDIAAAAAKLAAEAAHGEEPDGAGDFSDTVRIPREEASHERKERGIERDGAGPRKRRGDGMTRLVGKLDENRGVRPKDIVGAIANEAHIPGDSIGSVEIGEKYSVVEVPESAADKVIRALSRTTIKGQRVTVRRERER
jgi:ATP-dependent RNA helicase DeaD